MRRGASLLILLVAALAPGAAAHDSSPLGAEHVRVTSVPALPLVARSAVAWCGTGQPTAVDRLPNADLSSTRQVHVSYVIPADALDQFGALAPKIATDAEAMDTWWRGQDPARTIRFDLFAFAGCTATFGKLDIGFIRLPRVSSLYVGDAGVDRLLSDLGQLGALTNDKNLVYYDGTNPYEDAVCGTTFSPPNGPTTGGLAGIAFVWLRSLCGGDVGAGALNAAVAVHELIHGLGAVPRGAPNECPAPNDGHVCDSPSDIMYPSVSASSRITTEILDVNRDDYYGHSSPSRFDVQDSFWLTHLPQLALSVAVQGAGKATGTVRMTTPSAFQCTATCSLVLDTGTGATFVAQPGAGARFVGWKGACSGTAACIITLDAAKSIAAQFAAALARLTVSVSGKGKVTSTPAGISCPGRCSSSFASTATVRLRAKPAAGQRFVGWSGSCRGKGTCTLQATRDRSARATFRKKG
jgi:Divergent InlB B-repeat domain